MLDYNSYFNIILNNQQDDFLWIKANHPEIVVLYMQASCIGLF